MNKYLTVYKNALSTFMQYRLNLGLLVVSHIISLSGLMYLWIAVYESGQVVGTYTLNGILIYYVMLSVLRTVIAEGVGMGFEVASDIKDGIITNYLLKPFSYSLEQAMKLFGKATVNAVFIAPILILLIYLFKNHIPMPDTAVWLRFIGMTMIGLVFYYLIYYLASLASFWIINGRSAVYATLIFSSLLNGSLIPLDLFPDWFIPISNHLPFQFLMFVPLQTLLGRIHGWTGLLTTAAAWTAGLSVCIVLVWKLGVKKYEAVGR